MGELELMDGELIQEELDYEQRKAEFELREKEINEEYNTLKLRNDLYEEEKEKFEEEASKVHQYSLMLQQESEKIANFKNNYDAMVRELEKISRNNSKRTSNYKSRKA
jgi:uncharacterized membrane protein YgaE (UPF0421/DUF939 family)